MRMFKALTGTKVAFLVANGFMEADLVEAQRALQALGANTRIVSMDQGLASSWDGTGWGLNFAADAMLSEALAADFDMLVVPGGARSADKLTLTAHTRRFISGFLDAGKPLALFNEAVLLLLDNPHVAGHTLTGPENLEATAIEAGADWGSEVSQTSQNLMTGMVNDKDERAAFIEAMIAHFTADESMVQAA